MVFSTLGRGPVLPPPPLKVWAVLQLPKVAAAELRQLKSAAEAPLPASCSEVPGAVELVSDTGMAVLVMPAAGPLEAFSVPS